MVFAQARQRGCVRISAEGFKVSSCYPEALNNLGILYLRTQRRDEAVSDSRSAFGLLRRSISPMLNLARVYLVEGASDKARAVLLDLLMQHPDHAQAQSMLAQLPQ